MLVAIPSDLLISALVSPSCERRTVSKTTNARSNEFAGSWRGSAGMPGSYFNAGDGKRVAADSSRNPLGPAAEAREERCER